MPAFNIVRFRVKPGREEDFVDAHRELAMDDVEGLHRFVLVDTGNGTYSVVGEWETFDHVIAARPTMISMLDDFREMLEDMGSGLGVTDPVSGNAVVMTEGAAAKKAKRSASRRAGKKAKPAAKKKAAGKKKAPARKMAKKKAPAKKRATKRGRR